MKQYSREYWAEMLPVIQEFAKGGVLRDHLGRDMPYPKFNQFPDFYTVEKAPPITVPWDVLEDDIIAVSMNGYGNFQAHKSTPRKDMGSLRYLGGVSFYLHGIKGLNTFLSHEEWEKSLTYRPKD